MPRLTRRLLIGGGLTALLVGAVAAPASAHVAVNSMDAAPGARSELAFRVPTESDTASTVGLKVQFPTDQPIPSVSLRPMPGWSHTVTNKKLDQPVQTDDGEITQAVSVVEWTADSPDNGVKPGEYQLFVARTGPLPKADSLTFKAIQTYSDGNKVAWIEEQTAGGAEPEHPAPTLDLTAASSTDDTAAASTGSDQASENNAATTQAASDDGPSQGSVTMAMVLGIVGIVAGLVGVGLALTARRRTAGATAREGSAAS